MNMRINPDSNSLLPVQENERKIAQHPAALTPGRPGQFVPPAGQPAIRYQPGSGIGGQLRQAPAITRKSAVRQRPTSGPAAGRPEISARINFDEPAFPSYEDIAAAEQSKPSGVQVRRKPLPPPPSKARVEPNNGLSARINFRESIDTFDITPPPPPTPRRDEPPSALRIQAPTFTPSRPPEAYRPIVLKQPPSYGAHSAAQSITTEYARQAADRLIDAQGNINPTHIFQMLDDAMHDPAIPPHHKQHISKTLLRLHNDPQLRSVIESTCADPRAPLRGPAADLVRATLNLPPSHTRLSAVDARKAVMMSLFGNLRQGKVGSCFASSVAISIHSDDPRQLAGDLKQLLEKNSMMVRNGDSIMELPLNRRISRGSAQEPVMMDNNGVCHVQTGSGRQQKTVSYALHDMPAMQAALNAIGVRPDLHGTAVASAVAQLNPGRDGMVKLNPQQILQQIISFSFGANPRHRMASALNAFAGSEDVRLLRGWEYTMASHSEMHYNGLRNEELVKHAISDTAPDATGAKVTLSSRNRNFRAVLVQNKFPKREVEVINNNLLHGLEHQIRERFVLQYDADVIQPALAADGVSSRGGFTLYDKTPANDPSRWVRIDNPAMFNKALGHMAQVAAQKSEERMRQEGSLSAQNQAILQHSAQAMYQDALNPALTRHMVRKMNPKQAAVANPDLSKCEFLPWQRKTGGYTHVVNQGYGMDTIGRVDIGKPASVSHGAMQVIDFLGGSLSRSATLLRQRQQHTSSQFNIGVSNSNHAFNIKPNALREFWDSGQVASSTQTWVEQTLAQPARAHATETRVEPHLYKALQQITDELGLDQSYTRTMYSNIVGNRRPMAGGMPYSLAQVQHQLEAVVVQTAHNPDAYRDVALRALDNAAPPPTRLIADTNWAQKDGSPTYVGVSYNAYTEQLEAHLMSESGRNRKPLKADFFGGEWNVFQPSQAA